MTKGSPWLSCGVLIVNCYQIAQNVLFFVFNLAVVFECVFACVCVCVCQFFKCRYVETSYLKATAPTKSICRFDVKEAKKKNKWAKIQKL